MNWKNEAANDLEMYVRRKQSLENIKQQIAALEMQETAVRGAMSDCGPVMGGGSKYEGRILDNICKRGRLQITYQATEQILELVERGLAGLDDTERLVLDKFYIHHRKGENHVPMLMDELHVEQASIYRIKNQALHNFTVTMYGIPEM